MSEMTVDYAKEQLRLAREALTAVGGKLPEPSAHDSAEITCENLYTGAAVLTWFAAQAALQGGDYVWYLQAADQYSSAAHAQGCP